MNAQGRKMAAPVIAAFCLISYYAAVAVLLVRFNVPGAIQIVAVIVSCIVSALLIMVLVERIKEIRRGEEDDLGKY